MHPLHERPPLQNQRAAFYFEITSAIRRSDTFILILMD